MLMLTCARDPGQHLRLLAALSQILNNSAVRTQLLDAQTPEDVIAVMTHQAAQA